MIAREFEKNGSSFIFPVTPAFYLHFKAAALVLVKAALTNHVVEDSRHQLNILN